MKQSVAMAAIAVVFMAGMGLGYGAKLRPTPALYHARPAPDAAKALLEVAMLQAGSGSWERIAVGRAYYLGGSKAEGQKIFDALLTGKHDDGDTYRIARVYEQAGEWDKAKPMFDQYLAANPKESKDLAEVGGFYYAHGDHAGAEALFDRAFAVDGDEVWATIDVADAYMGVKPQ